MSKNNPRPLIMGILNATPDSFSDGGKHNKPDQALQRVKEMIRQGADIIDIGGESTRPGAKPVSAKQQIQRVVPIIQSIRDSISTDIIISVDTTNYDVAVAALDAGASWINDVSAGEDAKGAKSSEEPMLELAAQRNVPIVLMHRQGDSRTMQDAPVYQDVVQEVIAYLGNRAKLAISLGVDKHTIILDPGIGFGKLLQHNLDLLAHLDSLVGLGYQVLLGTSRKRFIGEICNIEDVEQRVAGTCATTALGVNLGVSIYRVHDVEENRHAADIAWAIQKRLIEAT